MRGSASDRAALEAGQRIADSDRAAVEQALRAMIRAAGRPATDSTASRL